MLKAGLKSYLGVVLKPLSAYRVYNGRARDTQAPRLFILSHPMPNHYPPNSITLKGRHACLLPLHQSHLPGLVKAASDGRLWELFFTSVPAPDHIQDWYDTACAQESLGKSLVFTVMDQQQRVLGSTRFCNMDLPHRRLEIGYTWYAQSVQRTGINTECKLLLLEQAFEVMNCNAVEFRTDWFNRRSQAAIERLGAKRDGVLRRHMLLADGRVRDTVVYSIIRDEWEGVKANLRYQLAKHEGDATDTQ